MSDSFIRVFNKFVSFVTSILIISTESPNRFLASSGVFVPIIIFIIVPFSVLFTLEKNSITGGTTKPLPKIKTLFSCFNNLFKCPNLGIIFPLLVILLFSTISFGSNPTYTQTVIHNASI